MFQNISLAEIAKNGKKQSPLDLRIEPKQKQCDQQQQLLSDNSKPLQNGISNDQNLQDPQILQQATRTHSQMNEQSSQKFKKSQNKKNRLQNSNPTLKQLTTSQNQKQNMLGAGGKTLSSRGNHHKDAVSVSARHSLVAIGSKMTPTNSKSKSNFAPPNPLTTDLNAHNFNQNGDLKNTLDQNAKIMRNVNNIDGGLVYSPRSFKVNVEENENQGRKQTLYKKRAATQEMTVNQAKIDSEDFVNLEIIRQPTFIHEDEDQKESEQRNETTIKQSFNLKPVDYTQEINPSRLTNSDHIQTKYGSREQLPSQISDNSKVMVDQQLDQNNNKKTGQQHMSDKFGNKLLKQTQAFNIQDGKKNAKKVDSLSRNSPFSVPYSKTRDETDLAMVIAQKPIHKANLNISNDYTSSAREGGNQSSRSNRKRGEYSQNHSSRLSSNNAKSSSSASKSVAVGSLSQANKQNLKDQSENCAFDQLSQSFEQILGQDDTNSKETKEAQVQFKAITNSQMQIDTFVEEPFEEVRTGKVAFQSFRKRARTQQKQRQMLQQNDDGIKKVSDQSLYGFKGSKVPRNSTFVRGMFMSQQKRNQVVEFQITNGIGGRVKQVQLPEMTIEPQTVCVPTIKTSPQSSKLFTPNNLPFELQQDPLLALIMKSQGQNSNNQDLQPIIDTLNGEKSPVYRQINSKSQQNKSQFGVKKNFAKEISESLDLKKQKIISQTQQSLELGSEVTMKEAGEAKDVKHGQYGPIFTLDSQVVVKRNNLQHLSQDTMNRGKSGVEENDQTNEEKVQKEQQIAKQENQAHNLDIIEAAKDTNHDKIGSILTYPPPQNDSKNQNIATNSLGAGRVLSSRRSASRHRQKQNKQKQVHYHHQNDSILKEIKGQGISLDSKLRNFLDSGINLDLLDEDDLQSLMNFAEYSKQLTNPGTILPSRTSSQAGKVSHEKQIQKAFDFARLKLFEQIVKKKDSGISDDCLFYEKTTDTQMYLQSTKLDDEPAVVQSDNRNEIPMSKPIIAKKKDQIQDYAPQIVFNVLNHNKNELKQISPSTAKIKIDEKRSQLSKYSDLSQPVLETRAQVSNESEAGAGTPLLTTQDNNEGLGPEKKDNAIYTFKNGSAKEIESNFDRLSISQIEKQSTLANLPPQNQERQSSIKKTQNDKDFDGKMPIEGSPQKRNKEEKEAKDNQILTSAIKMLAARQEKSDKFTRLWSDLPQNQKSHVLQAALVHTVSRPQTQGDEQKYRGLPAKRNQNSTQKHLVQDSLQRSEQKVVFGKQEMVDKRARDDFLKTQQQILNQMTNQSVFHPINQNQIRQSQSQAKARRATRNTFYASSAVANVSNNKNTNQQDKVLLSSPQKQQSSIIEQSPNMARQKKKIGEVSVRISTTNNKHRDSYKHNDDNNNSYTVALGDPKQQINTTQRTTNKQSLLSSYDERLTAQFVDTKMSGGGGTPQRGDPKQQFQTKIAGLAVKGVQNRIIEPQKQVSDQKKAMSKEQNVTGVESKPKQRQENGAVQDKNLNELDQSKAIEENYGNILETSQKNIQKEMQEQTILTHELKVPVAKNLKSLNISELKKLSSNRVQGFNIRQITSGATQKSTSNQQINSCSSQAFFEKRYRKATNQDLKELLPAQISKSNSNINGSWTKTSSFDKRKENLAKNGEKLETTNNEQQEDQSAEVGTQNMSKSALNNLANGLGQESKARISSALLSPKGTNKSNFKLGHQSKESFNKSSKNTTMNMDRKRGNFKLLINSDANLNSTPIDKIGTVKVKELFQNQFVSHFGNQTMPVDESLMMTAQANDQELLLSSASDRDQQNTQRIPVSNFDEKPQKRQILAKSKEYSIHMQGFERLSSMIQSSSSYKAPRRNLQVNIVQKLREKNHRRNLTGPNFRPTKTQLTSMKGYGTNISQVQFNGDAGHQTTVGDYSETRQVSVLGQYLPKKSDKLPGSLNLSHDFDQKVFNQHDFSDQIPQSGSVRTKSALWHGARTTAHQLRKDQFSETIQSMRRDKFQKVSTAKDPFTVSLQALNAQSIDFVKQLFDDDLQGQMIDEKKKGVSYKQVPEFKQKVLVEFILEQFKGIFKHKMKHFECLCRHVEIKSGSHFQNVHVRNSTQNDPLGFDEHFQLILFGKQTPISCCCNQLISFQFIKSDKKVKVLCLEPECPQKTLLCERPLNNDLFHSTFLTNKDMLQYGSRQRRANTRMSQRSGNSSEMASSKNNGGGRVNSRTGAKSPQHVWPHQIIQMIKQSDQSLNLYHQMQNSRAYHQNQGTSSTPYKKLTITGINPYPSYLTNSQADITTYKKGKDLSSERFGETSATNLLNNEMDKSDTTTNNNHLKKVNIDIELIKRPPLRSETINLAHQSSISGEDKQQILVAAEKTDPDMLGVIDEFVFLDDDRKEEFLKQVQPLKNFKSTSGASPMLRPNKLLAHQP